MAFTFCTSAEAQLLAGAGADSAVTGNSTSMDSLSDMVEGWIEQESGRDFHTNYATLNPELKGALRMASASRIAFLIVQYNSGGYNSIREYETLLDSNDDVFNKCMKFIEEWSSASVKVAT